MCIVVKWAQHRYKKEKCNNISRRQEYKILTCNQLMQLAFIAQSITSIGIVSPISTPPTLNDAQRVRQANGSKLYIAINAIILWFVCIMAACMRNQHNDTAALQQKNECALSYNNNGGNEWYKWRWMHAQVFGMASEKWAHTRIYTLRLYAE